MWNLLQLITTQGSDPCGRWLLDVLQLTSVGGHWLAACCNFLLELPVRGRGGGLQEGTSQAQWTMWCCSQHHDGSCYMNMSVQLNHSVGLLYISRQQLSAVGVSALAASAQCKHTIAYGV